MSSLIDDQKSRSTTFVGRALLWTIFATWSWTFIHGTVESNVVGQSFMHMIDLPFHEAGHVIFSPLGRFMQVLGGSLGQLLMPAVCTVVLIAQQRDAFGASIAGWWLAENLMDIAPYLADARSLDLILLGGVTGKEVDDYHDWEYLLTATGLLQYDHALAATLYGIGRILMISTLLYGGYTLISELRRPRGKAF